MNKAMLLISAMICTLTVVAQKQIVVDADAEMRSINGSFNKIKVSNAIDLYLSQSDNESLAVSADEDKYKNNIKTVVENNVLKIYYDGDGGWTKKNRQLRVYVSFKNLQELHASGASDVIIAGTIRTDNLSLTLSGASTLKGEIITNKLEVLCSGASDISIEGKAGMVTINSSGASDFKGYGLVAEYCKIVCSGASDVNITVIKEISAQASGASKIIYKGDGNIKDIQMSGASKINKKI